jgi:hypothetical protein
MPGFSILGPPQVHGDGPPLRIAEAGLLVALASSANALIDSDRLAEARWEHPPSDAVAQIEAGVAALRRVLRAAGPRVAGRLVSRDHGHLLLVEPDELDLDRFALLFRQGREALDADDPNAAAHLLDQALAIWRGPVGAGTRMFGWLHHRVTEIERLRAAAAERRLIARLVLGQARQVTADASASFGTDPWYEGWHAMLIAGPRDEGDQAFAAELGVLPDRVRRLLCLALLPDRPRGADWIEPPGGAAD